MRPVGQHLDRGVHVHEGGERDRSTGLAHDDRAKLLLFGEQPGLQLAQAACAPRVIGRPVCCVEGATRRRNRRLQILGRAVGRGTEHLFSGWIDVREARAGDRLHEPAIDQMPGFGGEIGKGHGGAQQRVICPPSTARI